MIALRVQKFSGSSQLTAHGLTAFTGVLKCQFPKGVLVLGLHPS